MTTVHKENVSEIIFRTLALCPFASFWLPDVFSYLLVPTLPLRCAHDISQQLEDVHEFRLLFHRVKHHYEILRTSRMPLKNISTKKM